MGSMLEAIGIIVGVVSGVAGLVLGILNHMHQRDATRPRVTVRPRVVTIIDRNAKAMEEHVGVMEVCNVGQVPVIGSTIGFLRGPGGDQDIFIVTPQPINGVEWAGELRPQHVAMLRFRLDELPDGDVIGPAYARTLVGDKFTATKRDMQKFANERAALAKSAETNPAGE